jgi:hypothetical protein
MTEVTIKIGKPVDQGQVDAAKSLAARKPGQSEVEGQWVNVQWPVCPYCYTVNEVQVDVEVYLWFQCWNCGNYFQA